PAGLSARLGSGHRVEPAWRRRLRLRRYELDGALISGEMQYEVGGHELFHVFESRLLTDEELDADLSAVGLRRRRSLGERRAWTEAVPESRS
ncbi:MAG: hypothetical protein M3Q59_08790, partial [Actinomycetota bacterium]|nr:hypothetical protein [Actinomycetota bacterium]